jgi:type IV pilus assembly protein PilV
MSTLTPRLGRTRSGGFTLLEVLVALFVLSIGLLGLAALQTTSFRYNTDSYLRTQATLLAYDIMDRMRANVSAVNAGSYDAPTTAAATAAIAAFQSCSSCECDTNSCTPTNLAIYDLGTWYLRQQKLLPGAVDSPATIARDASNKITITMRWTERDLPYTQVWEMQP